MKAEGTSAVDAVLDREITAAAVAAAAAAIAAFFVATAADAVAAEALFLVTELPIVPLPPSVTSLCEKKKRDFVPF